MYLRRKKRGRYFCRRMNALNKNFLNIKLSVISTFWVKESICMIALFIN